MSQWISRSNFADKRYLTQKFQPPLIAYWTWYSLNEKKENNSKDLKIVLYSLFNPNCDVGLLQPWYEEGAPVGPDHSRCFTIVASLGNTWY